MLNTTNDKLLTFARNASAIALQRFEGLEPTTRAKLQSARNAAAAIGREAQRRVNRLDDTELDAAWRAMKGDLECAVRHTDLAVRICTDMLG